jgi:hypothetical protein
MNKIFLGLIAIILSVGLYQSVTSYSSEANAATIQAVEQGAGQTANGVPAQAAVTAEKGQTAQAAASACGGSCNPATCGCSPSQCGGNSCGGSCGRK